MAGNVVYYKKVGNKLVPVTDQRIVNPSVRKAFGPRPVATTVRGVSFYHFINANSDFANGSYNFFMEAPNNNYYGNFLTRTGLQYDMDIMGIRLVLFDNYEANADFLAFISALQKGYWTLKAGQEVDLYTGSNYLISPIIDDIEVLDASTPVYAITFRDRYPNTKGYFTFEDEPGQFDWLSVSDKTPVWVEFKADVSGLTIPDVVFGLDLWVIPKREIFVS